MICLMAGFWSAERKQGLNFGPFGESALVALSLAVAVLARDSFLRDNVAAEPYMTIGLLCAAPWLALRGVGLTNLFAPAPTYIPPRALRYASSPASSMSYAFSPSPEPPQPIVATTDPGVTLRARIAAALARLRETDPPAAPPPEG